MSADRAAGSIRSMTGFGSAEGDVAGMRLTVEVRSVNHRFFNPAIKLPTLLSRFEGEVRELVRRTVARGHVTVSARFGRAEEGTAPVPRIDIERMREYADALRAAAVASGLDPAGVDLATVLRLPSVLTTDDAVAAVDDPAPFLALVAQAAAAHDVMRREEGGRMATFVLERLAIMEAAMARVAERAPQRLVEHRDRLRSAVRELTDGVAMDEQRVAQEIAILADRLDIGEEVARFASHLVAVRQTLATPPGDGAGKRLGFLLQELLREVNTTGSKAGDAALLGDVILMKEELERIREQVENLE
jgi:uncharacterized protein (TIGR00255 family)